MKKSIAILLGMALCVIMISCPNQAEGKTFDVAPALQLVPVNGGFAYSWQDSTPPADSVDLHWRVSQAPVETVNLIWEFGYVRKDAQLFDTIAVSLREDEFFSAFITVNKKGYASACSRVVVKKSDDVTTSFEFEDPPVLTVTPGAGSLICTWTSAYPFPGSYDLYYIEGNFTSAARVKAEGIRIRECEQPYTIGSLNNSKVYSVIVTAERMGYIGIDSAVRANQQPQ